MGFSQSSIVLNKEEIMGIGAFIGGIGAATNGYLDGARQASADNKQVAQDAYESQVRDANSQLLPLTAQAAQLATQNQIAQSQSDAATAPSRAAAAKITASAAPDAAQSAVDLAKGSSKLSNLKMVDDTNTQVANGALSEQDGITKVLGYVGEAYKTGDMDSVNRLLNHVTMAPSMAKSMNSLGIADKTESVTVPDGTIGADGKPMAAGPAIKRTMQDGSVQYMNPGALDAPYSKLMAARSMANRIPVKMGEKIVDGLTGRDIVDNTYGLRWNGEYNPDGSPTMVKALRDGAGGPAASNSKEWHDVITSRDNPSIKLPDPDGQEKGGIVNPSLDQLYRSILGAHRQLGTPNAYDASIAASSAADAAKIKGAADYSSAMRSDKSQKLTLADFTNSAAQFLMQNPKAMQQYLPSPAANPAPAPAGARPPAPGSSDAVMRGQASGPMGAAPANARWEILQTQKDLIKETDPSSRALLQEHLADMQKQLESMATGVRADPVAPEATAPVAQPAPAPMTTVAPLAIKKAGGITPSTPPIASSMPSDAEKTNGIAAALGASGSSSIDKVINEKIPAIKQAASAVQMAKAGLAAAAKSGDPASVQKYAKQVQDARSQFDVFTKNMTMQQAESLRQASGYYQ
jgi:hypothetical protein